MDPEKASSQVVDLRKPDTVLVCFFADNEFNWLHPSNIIRFEAGFDEKSRQKGAKAHKVTSHACTFCPGQSMHDIMLTAKNATVQRFSRAVEEAQEVLDRRCSREPKTSHNPPGVLLWGWLRKF